MPRAMCMEYEGVIYDVMNRGDWGGTVFRDDSDRKLFLETLGEACAKTDWQVHALCLMGTYTARFNRNTENARPEVSIIKN